MEKAGTEFELSDKELRRLKRVELLEMLLELSRENEDLMLELEEKNRIIEALNLQLENRKIDLKHAGTIAEASFKLNGVFEAAEKAAEQYLENLQYLCEREQNPVSEKRSRRKTYLAEMERKSRYRSRMKEMLWLKKKRKSEN
ncbi:MAG: hypothetical protein II251_09250 [Lachnospiraceae bacterium]|nr:hypothetical protein [Lachnospiraceae bacterium]